MTSIVLKYNRCKKQMQKTGYERVIPTKKKLAEKISNKYPTITTKSRYEPLQTQSARTCEKNYVQSPKEMLCANQMLKHIFNKNGPSMKTQKHDFFNENEPQQKALQYNIFCSCR